MESVTVNEIKSILGKMDVATARGRAEVNGRAINLEPPRIEIERAARGRAGAYADMAKTLCEAVRANRVGLSDAELERVEFVREQLTDLAKSVYVETISNAQGCEYGDPF